MKVAVVLALSFVCHAVKIRLPESTNAHFMARLDTDAAVRKSSHYRCVEICTAGEARCIAACEVDMYKCESQEPASARDECRQKESEKYSNFEKKAVNETGGNGTNKTLLLAARTTPVTPNFVAASVWTKSNHYGCVEICKLGEGRCIAACEVDMYKCESQEPQTARDECRQKHTEVYANFEKEVANKTAGNETNKTALLAAPTPVTAKLIMSKDDATHYRCQQICSVRFTSENNGMCISECETAMYRCQSLSTDDEVAACETKIEDKWTKEESTGNSTNGTNGSFLAISAPVAPNLVVLKDQALHYRCQSICSVRYTSENNGRCITECEAAMYRCQSLEPDTAADECETKIEDKWTKDPSAGGNSTNGTNGSK